MKMGRERIAIDRGRFRALSGFSLTYFRRRAKYVSRYVRARVQLQKHPNLLGFSRVSRIREWPGLARPSSYCLPRGIQGSSGTLVELRRFELLTF